MLQLPLELACIVVHVVHLTDGIICRYCHFQCLTLHATCTCPANLQSTLDWYPLSGKEANIGMTLTITGMKMVMQVRSRDGGPHMRVGCLPTAVMAAR
jgi:hypothetical protein